MFALLDANNFYVSCEKCFQPALRDKPVVVLSANDGCAIARSEEAKALGTLDQYLINKPEASEAPAEEAPKKKVKKVTEEATPVTE